MKILVNAMPLLAPLTGIGQYIRHLFTAMEQTVPQADLRMYYGLRCETGMRAPSAGATQSLQRGYGMLKRFVPRPRSVRRIAEKLLFGRLTHGQLRGALYHEPNYLPLPYDGPQVLTICDLSCFDHPETHPLERVRLMEREMPRAVDRADHLIVISEASGAALQRWFSVDPARITNTYLAADPRFHPRSAADVAPALAQLGLAPGAYLLCVGTLEPRKNLSTLFAAYAALPAALRRQYPLVVAGMSGWHTKELMHSAAGLLQRGELRLLGYVADELIPPLYAGAVAFAYPSRYEGFGLPALEAMASGVPVLATNRTSLPEVVGDAGVLVDPDDVDGMRGGLLRMLEDRTWADDLAHRGQLRAATFSWERCARETFAVYEQVVRQRGGL